MEEYSLTISENRKVNINPNTTKTKASLEESPHSLSKDKRTSTSSRRQQRHSTEIGSEYYRWWAVRSSLGFQTNEHIAGLLLDGFHALLQHVVVSCGGEEYTAKNSNNADDKGKNDSINSRRKSSISLSTSLPQTNRMFSSSFSSPPGAEEMEGFADFNNAILYYTNSLWWMCAQPDGALHKLKNASPALQEFLLRLIGYIRGGRGFNVNDRKKPPVKESVFLGSSVGQSNNFPLLSLNLRPTNDTRSAFINITHGGGSVPCFVPHASSNAPSLVLPSTFSSSSKPPIAFGTTNHRDNRTSVKDADDDRCPVGPPTDLAGRFQREEPLAKANTTGVQQYDFTKDSKSKENQLSDDDGLIKTSSWSNEEHPTFLNNIPSKTSSLTEPTDYSRSNKSNNCNDNQNWFNSKDMGDCNPNSQYTRPISTMTFNNKTNASSSSQDAKNNRLNRRDSTLRDKNNAIHFSSVSNFVVSGMEPHMSLAPVYSGLNKGGKDIKSLTQAPTKGTPLLLFPTQPVPGVIGTPTNATNTLQRVLYNTPSDGLPGYSSTRPSTFAGQRLPQCSTFPIPDALSISGQLPKQRQPTPHFTIASSYLPPIWSSRLNSIISQSSMIPVFYSPTTSLPPRVATTVTTNVYWTGAIPSYNLDNKNSGLTQSAFGCNQNNTMRDNFSLFKMYQDSSSKSSLTPFHFPEAGLPPSGAGIDALDIRNRAAGDLISSKKYLSSFHEFNHMSNSMYPTFHGTLTDPQPDYKYYTNTKMRNEEKNMPPEMGHFYNLKTTIKHEKSDNDDHGHLMNCLERSQIESAKHSYDNGEFNVSPNGKNHEYEETNKYALRHSHNRHEERDYSLQERNHTLSNISLPLSNSSCISQDPTDDSNHGQLMTTLNSSATVTKPSSSTCTTETSKMLDKTTNAGIASQARNGTSSSSKRSHTTTITSMPQSNNRGSKQSKSRRFVCASCGVVFCSGTDLLVHRYELHSYVCGECDGRFLSLSRLQQHKTTDHPQILFCSICRFSTYCKDILDGHKRSKHIEETDKIHTTQTKDKETDKTKCKDSSTIDEASDTTKPRSYVVDLEKRCQDLRHRTISPNRDPSQRDDANETTLENRRAYDSSFSKDMASSTISSLENSTSDQRSSLHSYLTLKDSTSSGRDEPRTHISTAQLSNLGIDAPCPGSVFPTFSKTVTHPIATSRADNIVSLFSQVKDYCHFDPARFLPPASEDSNDVENKESILVIDIDTDAPNTEQPPDSVESNRFHKKHNLNNDLYLKRGYSAKETNQGEFQKIGHNQFVCGRPQGRVGYITSTRGSDKCGMPDSSNFNKDVKKRPVLGNKSRKRKRKMPSLKLSNKRFKRNDECDNDESGSDTSNGKTKENRHTDVQINERSSQNSDIKTHRIWLDDFHNSRELRNPRPNEKETYVNWIRSSPQHGVYAKAQKRYRNDSPCSPIMRNDDAPTKQQCDGVKNDNDTLNARILSLRERHRSNSLPPKKRGIRKSYRIHGDGKIGESENTALVGTSQIPGVR